MGSVPGSISRYVLVAVASFSLGGGTLIATAKAIDLVRIADGNDETKVASVDSAGNLSVAVSNFPATQDVSGTVNVGNFPATQNVGGTVNVGNLPATQQVAGTVSVGNFPATQAVSGTVGISSTANTVRIGNAAGSPALVREVGDAHKEIFQRSFFMTYNGTQAAQVQIFVPPGKRLVIEYLSGHSCLPPGRRALGLFLILTNLSTSSEALHSYAPLALGAGGPNCNVNVPQDQFYVSQETKLYVEQNSVIRVAGTSDMEDGTTGTLTLGITGYFVTIP